jgi:nucleoside-diphosphate-sugar epimerase
MKKILLTGATGFIGSHVFEALRVAGGEVVVFAREGSNFDHIRSLDAEVRRGDLLDVDSICRAAEGCHQVIHTAALATDWATWKEFYDTNVQGTLNVLLACKRRGIQHAIVTGSISSYGEEDCCCPKNENSPYQSHHPYLLERVFPSRMNYYRDSKALSTRKAIAFAQDQGLSLTVIEPVWVYGEREFGTGFYSYVKTVKEGMRWMPGRRDNLFHVIYAKDLARAYLLAATNRLPGVERFIVGNPHPVRLQEILGDFCREAGLVPPHLLPRWMAYPVAFFLELAATSLRARRAPLLTRGRVDMFYDSIAYSVQKVKERLGFEAEVPLVEGIRATVAWYKANQLL